MEKQIVIRDNAKWFNKELLEAKRKRRKFEERWKRTKNRESRALYNKARNDYNTLIEKTKRKYYNNALKNNKDPRMLNKNLDDLIGLKKEKVLPENNGNHMGLANRFGKIFDDKTDKIYKSFTNENYRNISFMPQQVNKKLDRFKKLNLTDLKKVIDKVKCTYCENDPFPISDIKDAENMHLIDSVFLTIINMSIAQTVFPQSEKLASIKPTYKGKGDQNDLSSYRPISNLSYSSKLIETTIEKQLWAHLKDVNVIPGNQSAYRENHSTETTVCSIMNDMIQMVSEGKCGILVMLDLSAAFDTVVHEYLLNDLKFIGINGSAYRWFESYLQNREVTVVVSQTKSETRKLTKGVPQGSVLGPTLFTIYTIELSWILKKYNVTFKLYADDTVLFLNYYHSEHYE